ncbi:unnamed protein product [Mytilus coruscus]|uniref:BEN domain-containing protein n=1 Tax=Mytilus coruscus TaxID=42192 RepID=A0A6J8BM63_MYTCO|nr:unnamed protein product [Mytilus coruscus]
MAETLFSNFVAEHNLLSVVAAHVTQLCCKLFADSKIASKCTCKPTKCKQMIKRSIAPIKWNRDEYASAIILGSGDYAATSALVEKAKKDHRFSLAVESDDPSSPPVERAQPKKKRLTKKPALKPSGPIRQTPGRPKASRRPTATTPRPASPESSHQTQPAVPLPVSTTSTPVSIRGHNPTAPTPPLVSPFTPARPFHTSSQLGPVMSALAAIGSAVTSIQKNLDTLNKKVNTGLESKQDQILSRQHRTTIPAVVVDNLQVPAIPDMYNLSNEELTRIKVSAKSAGNFAAALTKRFFPELYGMDNLRYFYNWNGGGKHSKRELDPARREIIRQFTVQMYPEVRQEDIFRTNVINAVNEMLRRQPKKQRPALAAVQIENNPPSLSRARLRRPLSISFSKRSGWIPFFLPHLNEQDMYMMPPGKVGVVRKILILRDKLTKNVAMDDKKEKSQIIHYTRSS